MFYMLISPAKKLAEHSEYIGDATQIIFKKETAQLVRLLKEKPPNDIASLMRISDKLAHINYTRFQMFNANSYTKKNAMPALFLFQGHCYEGLQAASFSKRDRAFAQKTLGILSGLYGLLSPLDLIQPYRLEMGTRLPNQRGKNLYAFWAAPIVSAINQHIEKHAVTYLLNLASNEYFSAIEEHRIKCPIIKVEFKDSKNGKLSTVGIHAKRARGMMANFIIKNQCKTREALHDFSGMGYCYNASLSSDKIITFLRGPLGTRTK